MGVWATRVKYDFLGITMNAPCKILPAKDKKGGLTRKKEYDFLDGKTICDDSPHYHDLGNEQNCNLHFNTPNGGHFDY